jgi:hypothetical protein
MSVLLLSQQVDEVRGQGVFGQVKSGEGSRQGETTGAGAAWIDVKDSFAVFSRRVVGVATDDCGDAGCDRVQVEVMDGVDEVEETAGKLDDVGIGETVAKAVVIRVATNRGEGSDLAQGFEDVVVTYIASVQDVFDTLKGRKRLRTKEPVGVGDDANFHYAIRRAARVA